MAIHNSKSDFMRRPVQYKFRKILNKTPLKSFIIKFLYTKLVVLLFLLCSKNSYNRHYSNHHNYNYHYYDG